MNKEKIDYKEKFYDNIRVKIDHPTSEFVLIKYPYHKDNGRTSNNHFLIAQIHLSVEQKNKTNIWDLLKTLEKIGHKSKK